MAKTLEELRIKLGLEGVEEIAKLKGSLRGLGSTADITSKSLQEIAKGIKNYSVKGGESISVIKGQVTALKGLQGQAALNSKTFQQLGKDIAFYEAKLKKAEQTAETSQAAVRRRGTFVKATPGRFLEAEAFAASRPAELPFDEQGGLRQEFVAQQSRQSVLAEARIRLENRLQAQIQAVTRAQVDNNKKLRTAAEIVKTFGGELNELPATTNNVQMELRELRSDLGNLVIGGEEYISTLQRINSLQKQLDIDPLDPTGRKADIRSRLGTLGRFGGETDPVAKSIARNRRRRERGALPPLMLDQPAEATGLFRTIASIGSAEAKAATEMMGRSLSQVTAEINRQAAASNGSINSLQAQRTAFAQLRAGLDPTSQDFRELGKEIEKVDRRLEKLNKRRRRPTIGGIAQGLGGIAAGGVFGGPEGALGAAVGGAVGGVAGVAAGAALGAQVKMMREALGATSDYAAQLQKLEIALQGVAGAEYTDALKAANQVTKDFNVPIAVSTKGITRLSAAVIGAGGNVGDAEVVFRNITSAIKATGGGAQDVESAITAMVQTFSKGKVSAEELSGQLGERLPGAVTKFAEANDMTLPELQKAFKAGTVGLDQLMKFIISLGPEYEETARKIADSSADAGAKAAVAFDQVRREVGEALQPIGAQLQQAFSEFVLDILPAIKAGAVAAANGLNALLDASSFLIANFKELLIVAGAAGVALALQNLVGIAAALGTAFGKATVAMKGFTAASLLNPWVALAAGITAATVALVKHSKKNAEFNKSVIAGETTNEQASDRLREMNDNIKELEERLEKETNNRMIRALTRQLRTAKIAAGDLQLAMKLASSYEVAGIKYDRMTGLPINAPSTYTPHDYDDPDADPSGSGTGSAPMSEVELQLRRQMREALEKENEIKQSLIQRELDLLAAAEEIEDVNKRTNMQEQARFDHRQRLKQILEEEKEEIEKIQKPLGDLLDKYTAEIRTRERINELVRKGVNEGLAKELVKIEEIARAQKELLDEKIKHLEVTLAGLDAESELAKQIQKQIDLYKKARKELPKKEAEAKDAAGDLNKEETFMEGLGKAIKDQEDALKKLINPLNQVKEAANAIGEAFKTSFKGIITGSMTAREALRSFFQSIADHFADMAAQIAAEAIKLAALKFVGMIVKSFVGASAAPDAGDAMDGGGVLPMFANPGETMPYAQGGYVPGGFKAFSQGGIVSQPTLGMVGEGGEPEYIIPQSKMRESMSRYSRGVRGPGVIPSGGGATAASGGSTAVAAPIDVRYTVERINSVDYVTADQFQRGMQQAAAQGATQGEQRALTTLRQNTSQRRRIGL
jgi:tape measure domain-containing protein